MDRDGTGLLASKSDEERMFVETKRFTKIVDYISNGSDSNKRWLRAVDWSIDWYVLLQRNENVHPTFSCHILAFIFEFYHTNAFN
jgi:hypothetical protein